MKSERVLRAVLFLIVAELLLGGLAAALNRTLVEMPAWHHLGAGAWATFSRMADLGNGETSVSARGHRWNCIDLGGCNRLSLQFKKTLVRGPPSLWGCSDGGLWLADYDSSCSHHAESASNRQ